MNEKTMGERWRAIQRWCMRRGINQIYSYFEGSDMDLSKHERRIRFVNRSASGTRLVEADEPWLASMERTINAINNR